MDTVRQASKRRKLRKCKIYQEAPGLKGSMDKGVFSKEGHKRASLPEGERHHCVGDGRSTEAPGKLLRTLMEKRH